MVLDIILGSFITLVAAVLTFFVGKLIKNTALRIVIGGFFPVILNAFLLPLLWILYGAVEYVYLLQALFLIISQSISIYGFGTPLYFAMKNKENKGIIK